MVEQFDIYWVDLNPTVGAEMQKVRPLLNQIPYMQARENILHPLEIL